MKFNAQVKNGLLLHRLFNAYEKISKKLVLKINTTNLTFIYQECSFQSWSQLETDKVFHNMNFSVTTMDSIYVQLEVEQFSKILKCFYAVEGNTSSFTTVTIKLGKVATESTSMFLVSGTDSQGSVKVVHEIPVTLLTMLQVTTLNEPELPSPNIQIVLPANLKTIKVSCDAMRKGMSKHAESIVRVTATCSGGFEISDYSSAIRWSKLVNPPVTGNSVCGQICSESVGAVTSDSETSFYVNVDIKDLCKTMQALLLNPSHAVACILDKRCLLMYFFLEPNSSCNMSFLLLNKTAN